jgi:hypothetical protein
MFGGNLHFCQSWYYIFLIYSFNIENCSNNWFKAKSAAVATNAASPISYNASDNKPIKSRNHHS